jgi:hypothetical protein
VLTIDKVAKDINVQLLYEVIVFNLLSVAYVILNLTESQIDVSIVLVDTGLDEFTSQVVQSFLEGW